MQYKKIFISLSLLFVVVPAYAAISNEESTSPEFLVNYGYSPQTAEKVQELKYRSNGDKFDYKNTKKNWFIRTINCLDPGFDDGMLFHYSIDPSAGRKDLQ